MHQLLQGLTSRMCKLRHPTALLNFGGKKVPLMFSGQHTRHLAPLDTETQSGMLHHFLSQFIYMWER